ncbi:MAG: aminoglycoside phosphotransferase family protein [Acidobacteria bacterium]|jgi:hypothetical protein|nr:aminoglycoside phosphotransferase family protein [Acidobacteriota bacterium]
MGHILSVVKQFQIEGEFIDAWLKGSGHINDTYLAQFRQGNFIKSYIVQRINHQVFQDPPAMMENIIRVTRHIWGKLESRGVKDRWRRVLEVIFTYDGLAYYRDPGGNFWRVYNYIERTRAYDVISSPGQAYEAARMFGSFLEMLHDFPGPPLHETIPGFHDGLRRFEAFQKALADDVYNRAREARQEIEFTLAHAGLFNVLPDLVDMGKIPVRSTHNDTKVNNVLLDEVTGEGVCVIDLDTVMPGLSLFDFGDLARSTLSSTAEDEPEAAKIEVDMSRFEAILKGFLVGSGGILTGTERSYLVFSTKLIALMIGVRFLTDFLLGDIYFKIHKEKHNLIRCRSQFKLVQSILAHEEKMESLVEKLLVLT